MRLLRAVVLCNPPQAVAMIRNSKWRLRFLIGRWLRTPFSVQFIQDVRINVLGSLVVLGDALKWNATVSVSC